MYRDFYGLSEKPFALLPDPRFLFLGSCHSEALAHLVYGISEGEGFIQVTGQVGTGKTTLCRALVERLGSDVTLAYIFNPSTSELELLAAINREFGISTAGRTRDELIEELNLFLLKERAEGRKPILIIDEAQNLDTEVLEQVRLLSNLETEREKLIQIVLIGQPELDEKLDKSQLRQLRQRITVRWSLSPFSTEETRAYLEHRLSVAGAAEADLFTPGSVRALRRVSGGIPRLINAIADRSLLLGYATGSARISARLVRKAARELQTRSRAWVEFEGLGYYAAAGLLAIGTLLGVALVAFGPVAPELPAVAAHRPTDSLLDAMRLSTARTSAAAALDALLDVWGYAPAGFDELDPNRLPELVRSTSPLILWTPRLSRAELVGLGLPAVLELRAGSGERRFATLTGLPIDGVADLVLEGSRLRVEPSELDRVWTGRAFVAWSNYESLPNLSPGMHGSAVRWLQARLTELQYMRPGDASGTFDLATAEAIRRFQIDRGVGATGEVGPETMILLYRALRYGSPTLQAGATS